MRRTLCEIATGWRYQVERRRYQRAADRVQRVAGYLESQGNQRFARQLDHSIAALEALQFAGGPADINPRVLDALDESVCAAKLARALQRGDIPAQPFRPLKHDITDDDMPF